MRGAIMNNCRWVLTNGKYCENVVKFRFVKDDDDNKVIKYEHFCPFHMEKAVKELDLNNERD
jgi:hypothetical protein